MNTDSFQRRSNLIGLVMVGAVVLAGLRLFYLQIIKHDYYSVLASEEQRRKYEVPSNRGRIFFSDRGQKTPVVLNRELKTLYADPRYVVDKAETAKRLADLFKKPATGYEEAMLSDSFYVVLEKGVEPATAEKIKNLELPGIGLTNAPVRVYPEGTLGAQVLGFVNTDGNGQYGIEEQLNQQLAGSKGLLSAKTDTRGIPIATSDNLQLRPVDGADVVLTIDRNVQAKLEQVLSDGATKYKSGNLSAVVMDPADGRVLAMAGYPSFDASKYQEVSDYSVFSNPAATGLFEPGSVFKVFAMAAGLDSGAVTAATAFTNTGSTRVADYEIKNAVGIPNGSMTMSDVLSKSVNTGMVQLLRMMGGSEINEVAKSKLHNYYTQKFRFGSPTGIELPGEPAGLIADPSENDVTYANMTFGQGLTATLLQIANGYCAIANGGTWHKPYIVDHIAGADGQISKTQPQVVASSVIGQPAIAELKKMMEAVVVSGGGSSLKVAGYRIGGKTGTAQIPNPRGGYFDNRDIGTFAAIAPLDNSRYVIVVRIDEPATTSTGFAGSGAAAPMAAEIGKWLLNYGGVAPAG